MGNLWQSEVENSSWSPASKSHALTIKPPFLPAAKLSKDLVYFSQPLIRQFTINPSSLIWIILTRTLWVHATLWRTGSSTKLEVAWLGSQSQIFGESLDCKVMFIITSNICIIIAPWGLNRDQGPIVLVAVQTSRETWSLCERVYKTLIACGTRYMCTQLTSMRVQHSCMPPHLLLKYNL